MLCSVTPHFQVIMGTGRTRVSHGRMGIVTAITGFCMLVQDAQRSTKKGSRRLARAGGGGWLQGNGLPDTTEAVSAPSQRARTCSCPHCCLRTPTASAFYILDEQTAKTWHIHTMEYYLAIKKDEIMKLTGNGWSGKQSFWIKEPRLRKIKIPHFLL